jgi:hypothetical protein
MWKSWKIEATGWIAPPKRADTRSGEDLLRAQEIAIKERVRQEAKDRLRLEKKQGSSYRRILTEKLLHQHDQESRNDSDLRRRSKSFSVSTRLAGLPGMHEGRLQMWSSERATEQASPTARSVAGESVVSQVSTARGRRRSCEFNRNRSTSPNGSTFSTTSRKSRGREVMRRVENTDMEASRRRGRRSRSTSLPSRRADGARTNVFVPAAPI